MSESTPLKPPPPTLRLDIDCEALAANWRALDNLSGSASAGAAVKANCYGLSVDKCVPALRDAGARVFFVAHWSEVGAVLRHVPPEQVAVFHGPLTNDEAAYAKATGVRPVINSLHQAEVWLDAGGGFCDVMIDSGINRLGMPLADLSNPLVQRLEIDTLMSHLACADEESAMNARQLSRFRAGMSEVRARHYSLANSAGIALGSDYAFDLTRPGLALYGGLPRVELAPHIRQVVYPQAALILVRDIEAGETVGYNATFQATRKMRTGVVSLGYADGFLRSRAGEALVHEGRHLPILGRISMDMVVIDLAEAPQLAEGDWVSIPYHLPDAAQQSSLSQYELLTVLGRRFA